MKVTRLAAAAALALLAAGCGGEPAGEQVEVQGVTSTAPKVTSTTQPATTRRTATTTTRRTSTTTTTRRTTTSKPATKPVLTVEIRPPGAGRVEVSVDQGTVAGICPPACRYTGFSAGTNVTVRSLESRLPFTIEIAGGQTACPAEAPCQFILERNTTVTVTFPAQGGG
jgi:hypothetical protein